jgi:O-acetyl-ADP-ribose deacetylase (regulator of RNase III)
MSEEGDLVLKLHGAEMQELPGKVAAVTLHTSRGDIQAILHPSKAGRGAVIWTGGSNGDVNGPAGGVFADLAGDLAPVGVSSLRIRYRFPNQFYECVLDVLAGVSFLRGLGSEGIAVIGHGRGGAVAIMAGVLSEHIKAVAALSSIGYGTHLVRQLSPRPLLLVHGSDDDVASPSTSEALYRDSGEPKRLVNFPGAGHSLDECRGELATLLAEWLSEQLGGTAPSISQGPPTVVRPFVVDDEDLSVKQLVLFQGDITALDVDAIVCPNNDQMWITSGVTGAILRKGGDGILREAIERGPGEVGSCIVTGAGNLKSRYVFHAIASGMLRGMVPPSPDSIVSAVNSCLHTAEEMGLKSIAFPAIGTGGGGLPFEIAAAALLPVVVNHLRRPGSVEKVIFALYGSGAFQAFSARLDEI